MRSPIPSITISKVMSFNNAGMPDSEQFKISAIIDTPDEITPLGSIRFEDASDLVALFNILGTYIRMYDLDQAEDADAEEQEEDRQLRLS